MNTSMRESAETLVRQARGRQIADIVRLSARRTPNKIALVFEGREDSFAGLDKAIDNAANALRDRGIVKGDRVAILSHNNRAFVILRFATARLGAILTPINFMLNAPEIAYILEHSGAALFIAEDSLCAVVDEAIAQSHWKPARRVFVQHSGATPPVGWECADDWFDKDLGPFERVEIDEDEPIQLMYTSGTESKPKGALLTSRALFAQYASCIAGGDMFADDISLNALPLYHCAQLDAFMTVDMHVGATSILLRGADPTLILETIERARVTKFFCPPTVWIALLRHPDFDKRDLSSLRKGYSGASSFPPPVIEELLRRLPNMRLWNVYGQTELAPVATFLQPEQAVRKIGSVGMPALNVETRVVDDDDNEVPPGEIGEIAHRSPQCMAGYYKDPEKTAEAFRNGWFHSGDLGYFDEEGYLYVVDRKKDMIKTGGENVASREVEEAVLRHPKVAEVAVFGVPDEKWIEAVTAVIVLRAGETATAEEVIGFCREKLASYKTPKNVHFIAALPKNASGKILKRELRQQFGK
jgi:fatty-acyl-CoA synthase